MIAIIILTISVLPSFALSYEQFTPIPSDLGNRITTINYDNEFSKYYFKINCFSIVSNRSFQYSYYSNNNTVSNGTIYWNYDTIGGLNYSVVTLSLGSLNSIFNIPRVPVPFNTVVYIPVYCLNVSFTEYSTSTFYIEIYESTLDSESIKQEYYTLGYNVGYSDGYDHGYIEGYPTGFDDAIQYSEDLNLVQHVERVMTNFVGPDNAKYITPVALALIVLLVYFIFIRWLLSLTKSKTITRVADIVVAVACVSIMVVLYAPMINFAITQHQIVETVYSVGSDTAIIGG